jgi:hypothetical protein
MYLRRQAEALLQDRPVYLAQARSALAIEPLLQAAVRKQGKSRKTG